jgi:signal peptidase I
LAPEDREEILTGDDQPVAEPGTKKKKQKSFWRELPGLLITALVIAVLIKTFLLQPFYIPSESMVPTIQINDRVMVNKLSIRFGTPDRFDVVVFTDPGAPEVRESLLERVTRSILEAVGVSVRAEDLIKRVIGLPGETITIENGRVHIDGVPLHEPYLQNGTHMPDFGPVTVGEDEVFLMGDNRDFSLDSRAFGPVPISDVIGRAFMIIWPPSRIGGL